MRYQPLDAKRKNEYVAPNWTIYKFKKMMHYYNRLRWLEHIPYKEYEHFGQEEDMFSEIEEGTQ